MKTPTQTHPLKNSLLALAMMVFLALSFKLAGDVNTDTQSPSLSATDSVISTLQNPER